MSLLAVCQLRRDPAEVGRARGLARKALTAWGLAEHTGIAELIVSELATNSLRHGAGPIVVRLSYAGGSLRAEVHDDGAGRPVRQQPAATGELGRGLALLDGLIELHGGTRGVVDDDTGQGKTVYVTVSVRGSPGG